MIFNAHAYLVGISQSSRVEMLGLRAACLKSGYLLLPIEC